MASITENLIEQVVIGTDNPQTAQIASTAYGICNDSAAEQHKTVEMAGFVTHEGVTVHIKFVNTNTAASPTLNVNGTGGFPIMQYGETHVASGSLVNGWPAGAVIAFTLTTNNNAYQWVRDFGVNTDTQYSVQNTYDNTSEDPISGKGVKAALETLDITQINNTAGKTVATITEADGIMDATFQDISITESQVLNPNDNTKTLVTDLAEKAPLASPVFTGTPKSVTPTNSSDDTMIATKGYVDSKSAGLTGAMHYIPTVEDANHTITITKTEGTNGAPDKYTITGTGLPENYTPIAGDVIIHAHQEYVYGGNSTIGWRLLGDEGSYALKTNKNTALHSASVNYTAQTLTNNTFSGLTSVKTAGTLPTLQTQSVTVTGMATEGSVTTASVSDGSLVINIGTAATKANAQTFNAVKDNGFTQGAMPTFNSGSTTVGITTGGATLSADSEIWVVVP